MILLIVLTAILFTSPAIPFEQLYKREYQEGVNFLTQNQAIIDNGIIQGPGEREKMLSIVFPELIRYSLFSDFFETKSLEVGYVNFGAGLVDFSIGRFQMKPSFVESLEEEILKVDTLRYKYTELLTGGDSSDTWKRQVRVTRLSSLAGQLLYLSCFYDIMEHKYRSHTWSDVESRLRFYATAYNHGFTNEKQEITRWENVETFPFGWSFDGSQYIYADIAVHFYRERVKNRVPLRN